MIPVNHNEINELIEKIDLVIADVRKSVDLAAKSLESVHEKNRESARNLVHYRCFRKHDLTAIQTALRNLGITGFSHSEGHVMASLLLNRNLLMGLIGRQEEFLKIPHLDIPFSKILLETNTTELMGPRRKGRRVGIMVTQPTETANKPELVEGMLKKGMDCARVNCAHDSPEVWKKIIDNLRTTAAAENKKICIAMDLAGPKIRTGAVAPGRRVKKIRVKKDETGRMIKSKEFELIANDAFSPSTEGIPVGREWLSGLKAGDELLLNDTRGKKRRLVVTKRLEGDRLSVMTDKNVYIESGAEIRKRGERPVRVGMMPAVEKAVILKKGEVLEVFKDKIEGRSSLYDQEGKLLAPARISCSAPGVFSRVQLNDPVLFDDGKIEGVVIEKEAGKFTVRITRAAGSGASLKAEKGINFPATRLGIDGLTETDKRDLEFVAKHADIVNFSFVNSPDDVRDLIKELKRLGVLNKLGIVLKIETQEAYENLSEILLAAMEVRPVGVMIARGDLAVETGWEQIGMIQEEILSICGAAHVPVIWATQVLENLAKKGLPSRSEITDAMASLKAECVMLNKGNYIEDAIGLLDRILRNMEQFRSKKERMLPRME
ncbi:pyruvate kinase [Robertkochia aurantiaca]|uniref:pyruvate kinase n=1 Tax=Robertkochia aurantiaca TaxID=2873700 RepID=UPI001CCDCE01|nr:pyruvate kinase [Robertkochia sp. 3YJGBD-33]